MILEGAVTCLTNRIVRVDKRSGPWPSESRKNLSLSHTSERTAQQVQSRIRYSTTKIAKHTFSTMSKASFGSGAFTPTGSFWNSGEIERMKQTDDVRMVARTKFEMTSAAC